MVNTEKDVFNPEAWVGFEDRLDEVKQHIADCKKILKKIHDDGYDEHMGLYEEALEYFLYDVLEGSDFERLKKEFKIK